MKRTNAICVAAVLLAIVAIPFYVYSAAITSGALVEYPRFKAWSTDGKPLSAGLLYSYEPNSSTQKALYTTHTMTTEHANPVVLDSNGEASIWSAGPVKLVLKTSGGTLLWSMDWVNGVGGVDGNTTIYPEQFGAVGNGSTDDFLAYQAAISACTSLTKCHIVHNGTYRLSTDVTIPTIAELEFRPGGMLDPDVYQVVTINSPDYIIARKNQQIFTGSGTITFTNPGTVHAAWWGADSTGVSDSYDEVAAAIAAIPIKSTLSFSPGTYLMDDSVSITKGISITCPAGEATTLSAGTSMSGKSMFVYTAAQPYADLRRIEHCKLDGNSVALNGFEVKQAYGLTFQDVKAIEFLGAGFLMNGDADAVTPTYGGYVYNINFINCASNSNKYGYYLWKNRNHTAFEAFNFWGSGAYSNSVAGLWMHGDNATTKSTGPGALTGTSVSGFAASWYGGQIENTSSGGASVKATNGARLTVSSIYIEPASGGLGFVLENKSIVEVMGGQGPYYNSTFSDNSTMCFSGAIASVAFNRPGNIPVSRQCVGDLLSDKTDYGPPSWGRSAYTSSGYWWFKGLTMLDGQGTPWMSLGDRTNGDKNRWTPINGRIVIPFDYTHMDAGYWLAYWNEGDFVVTQVDLIVDDNFTAAEDTPGYCASAGVDIGINIGTTTYSTKFISNSQGAISKLVHGAVIRGTDNVASDNVLGSNKAYFMEGVAYSDIGADWDTIYDNSYIYVYGCPRGGTNGSWTAGSGYIVITGYPLEYN